VSARRVVSKCVGCDGEFNKPKRTGVHDYCSLACAVWSRVDTHGPVPAHVPELGECWPWTGATNANGYGTLGFRGANLRAHRAALSLSEGLRADMMACHKCDNRLCCRPDHMFQGTGRDNMADCVAKRRNADNLPIDRFGSNNGHNKLTECDVVSIIARRAAGESAVDIAAEFRVSPRTISDVTSGANWSHITGIPMPDYRKRKAAK